MDLPKCQRCGTRLTLSAFDRYDGFCHDCYSYKQGQQVETLLWVIFAFVTLLLLLFVTGTAGYF